ncbi:unnamed protein product [Blepharisma stoltei]|uniref:Uncharacterized protein n=1 Tax=Blepharisma stoltei TaxID=1481888 RepID=A0AAU9IEE7_9CILI|nr:unnamed protein product [Blepharisma stoltei]
MGDLNIMCILYRNNEGCDHYECHWQQLWHENPYASMNLMILEAMNRNSMILSNLANSHWRMANEVSFLYQTFTEMGGSTSKPEEVKPPDPEEIVLQALSMTKENCDFPIRLELDKTFPARICKERGFKLSFHLENRDKEIIALQSQAKFQIFIVTHNEPPIVLNKTLSGKPILRGTYEATENENGNIQFNNVVINEVSSHYTNNCFIFIALCLNNLNIKPFIKKNLNVRARKALKHRKLNK